MYGLPPGFDPTFFVSKTLEQICFTENQVVLQFSEHISIVIEGSFSYALPEQRERITTEPPLSNSNLMRFLGSRINDATGTDQGTLKLVLDGGGFIECHDDSRTAESYHISHDGGTIHI